ncbi:MAG: choice-of-anchor Q domain-containing protein [Polyangiaceae bacterium]
MRSLACVLLAFVLSGCGGEDSGAPANGGGSGGTSASGGGGGSGATGGGGSGGKPGAFTPPIGIPAPEFGIEEKAPALPSPWSDEVAGFYYVEAANCDDARAQGRPGAPRCTIPATLPAGALVALSGQLDEDQSFTAQGSAASPVFVVGFDGAKPPLVTSYLSALGSFVVVEHVNFGPRDAADDDFGFGSSEGSHHVVLRHAELSGNLNRAGGIGLGSWSYSGAESLSFTVIYHVSVHDLGTLDANWDQDAHCVTVNGSVDHLWVLDSELRNCSGDGIQIEAQEARRDKIHHVYYGRNSTHDNRQSGGWVKHASDVIFSQNVAYGIRNNSGGPGACFGQQYGPERVWYVANEAHHCNVGILTGSGDPPGDGQNTYLVGNVIHDTDSENVGDPYNSGCISLRGPGSVWVVNDTCTNTDGGVFAPPGLDALHVWNTIVRRAPATQNSTWDLYTEGSVSLDVKNSIFSQNPSFTDGNDQTTCAGLANFAAVSGCSTSDPLFVSATDFHLQAGSPAVDQGIDADVYAAFEAAYGTSIRFDASGTPRPAGAGWDIGAYER